MRSRLAVVATAVSVTLCAAPVAHAQGYPFSQRGSVSQRVAFTELSIAYGRPTARGRTLFGALVPWDSIWHPGADLATELAVSRDITLEGQPIAKGRYTLWIIPRASGAWTVILNRRTGIQHTPYPGAAGDALRVDVAPTQASHLETLTWLFPAVLRDEATLRFQWGTTAIDLKVTAPYRPTS